MIRGILQIIASFIPVTIMIFVLMQCQEPYRISFAPPADIQEARASFPQQIGKRYAVISSPAPGYLRADYGGSNFIRVRLFADMHEASNALFITVTRTNGTSVTRSHTIRAATITESRLFSFSTGTQSAYTTTDGRRGYYWICSNAVYSIEGRSSAVVDALARAYPFIEPLAEDEKTITTKLADISPAIPAGICVLCFLLCAVFFSLGIFSFGEAMLIRRPGGGVMSVSRDVLMQRIRELSGLPLEIIPEKNDIILRWNLLDAHWFSPADLAGERKVWEMHLRFDDIRHAVYVSDVKRTARIAVGADGTAAVTFSAAFTLFKGIISESEHGFGIGSGVDGVPEKKMILEYGFSTGIIKRPVREIILAAGWTWEPRVFLP
ncbi:MAG: hypothetical protein HZC28_11230 [Spirochaetes bacterium]|nr:hypothetical protein [Spirochaetota bacterium]